ncbi:hypothetical protein CBR_g32453 [Chara braunii]|uniref:Integrase catalytic domain-containing protein n=1 Tax=Chara braunii TaxID=69332 RepID=A0A388LGW2_CHABU|nr:hypothetical protein CBR_g32453 [Chara braunii]|eukprot:GBG81463.1 hypothetical protein CBR_g32453 [Chara braunii]
MADGGKRLVTLNDLIDALDKHERAPSNVPKVETFHFKGDRVSDWLDLTEQALVGLSDEVKLQRVLRYVLHSHHREVSKVMDAVGGSWTKFGDLMRRKYRLGDGLLTMTDLEAMNKEDFSTIGAFVHEFKKKARKVHGISEEAQCATFLGLLTGSEAIELTKYGEGSERLTWATIDKGVEEGSLDQVEQHQMRLQRRKRKERDATTSGTPGVKRIVTDVLAALGYDNEAEIQKREVLVAQGRASGDLQRLNAVTVRDAGGLPNTDALSESCAGRPIISLIDLYSAYDQFPVYPPDRPVTAMHTPRGLIHMNVAPQGWTNAVAMVQRHMIRAMQTVSPHITQPYIDDLAVKGPKEKEEDEVMPGVRRFVWKHIQDIDQVLGLLEEHSLTASGPKSKHCMRGATILGFVCNEKGRRPDVKKTDKILEWSVPFQSITDVRSFLGICGFWRSFVKDFATKTEHLRKLVRDKNRADGLSRINWDGASQESIEDTQPVDGFLDQEEDVRLHINEWSLKVPSCVTHPIWLAPRGYKQKEKLVLKPFQEEDPWGSRDIGWMMKLAPAGTHSLAEEVRTIEEGPTQVEEHEQLKGGMYLLTNTLLQGNFDQRSSSGSEEGELLISESQDDEFEEGEIREAFCAEEYDGIYRELGLLLSSEIRDRDASAKAQKMRHLYVVRDSHLFIKRQVENPKRIVCGRNRQIDVIATLHDGIAGGHRGVSATCAKISELYRWDGMLTMVIKYWQSCIPCQQRSTQRPGEPLHPTLEREVGAVVHLDLFFMPLREDGSNYIFDARDNLTGFVDGRAIHTKTGPVLTRCIEEYYLRYSFVREFVMDRGSEFTCNEVRTLLAGYGVVANYTTAAHPQANAPVERGRSTITNLLAKWTEGRPNQWPKFLRAAFFVENVTVKRTTKSDFSKAVMQRGRRDARPRQGPQGAAGRGKRHEPPRREPTPEFDDDNIQFFLDVYRDHAAQRGWSVVERIHHLRGIGRFEEPVAQICEEALTWPDVEAGMQRLRVSPRGRDGMPIRLEEGNAEEFIPAYEHYMLSQGIAREEWVQTLLIWTRGAERPVARQIRERARDWEDCQAQLRRAFGQPERERPEPRVEKRRRSRRPREPAPREVGLTGERSRAPAHQGDEPAGPALEEESFPACDLRAVEFRRITSEELRPPSPLSSGQELDIPGETPFRNLATHLDVSRWEASQLGEGSIEPTRYVPLEEPLDPEKETGVPDREEPQDPEMAAEQPDPVRPQDGEVIMVGDDTPPYSPVPEPAQHSWPEGIREPGSEEIPEQAEMEAAGIELTPPVEPKTSEQRIDELWAGYESQRDVARQRSRERGQADEEAGELREMGDLGFSATRKAIEHVDRRICETAVTSFQWYNLLSNELRVRELEVEHLTTQLAEEPGQRGYAPELGELRTELGSWATGTDSGGPDSGRQQRQEVMSEPAAVAGSQPSGSWEDEVVVVTEKPHEEGPRELDTPECGPASIAVREGEGAEAMEPGPQGHMGLPSCHEVTTETMGTPSTPSSRGRKKKTAKWHDTFCFWCKKEGRRAVDCPELLEDKAEGRVAEVDGKFYDRQGRVVERAPDGGRAQLFRQNQEELCE